MIKPEPLVSIIVPNYNHSSYLQQRLESIFSQTFQDFEIILLDDASNDNSIGILKSYSSHPKVSHMILNKKNSGNTFIQWNRGLLLAKGKYVWIAESDDLSQLNFLERLLKFHDNHENLSLVFCQSRRIDSKGKISGDWLSHTSEFEPNIFAEDFVMDGNMFIENFLIHKNVIPNVSAVIFKRDLIDGILPLDIEPYLKYIGDWFYYIQLICNSKVGFIADPLNFFRHHKSSVINTAARENNREKIIKMELLGRKKMMNYISELKPANQNKIWKEWKKRNEKLNYEIIVFGLKRGKIFSFCFHFFFDPKFSKKFLYSLRRSF